MAERLVRIQWSRNGKITIYGENGLIGILKGRSAMAFNQSIQDALGDAEKVLDEEVVDTLLSDEAADQIEQDDSDLICIDCGKTVGNFIHLSADRCGSLYGCTITKDHKASDHHVPRRAALRPEKVSYEDQQKRIEFLFMALDCAHAEVERLRRLIGRHECQWEGGREASSLTIRGAESRDTVIGMAKARFLVECSDWANLLLADAARTDDSALHNLEALSVPKVAYVDETYAGTFRVSVMDLPEAQRKVWRAAYTLIYEAIQARENRTAANSDSTIEDAKIHSQ